MKRLFSLTSIILLATLLVACGSASTNTSGSANSATKTTTTNCLTAASGTIQTISNGGLQLKSLQGKTVQVTFTSATTFTRQSAVKPSSIKTGTPVSIIIVLNADNSYSALSVSIRSSSARLGGFTGGAKLCSGQTFRGNGTPGAFGGPGFGGGTPGASGGQVRQTVTGTVSQVNGSMLTVADTSGNNITANLTATTRITAQQTFPASDLHSGVAVTVIGTVNGQGVISASSVSLLQGLPNRRPRATPTVNA